MKPLYIFHVLIIVSLCLSAVHSSDDSEKDHTVSEKVEPEEEIESKNSDGDNQNNENGLPVTDKNSTVTDASDGEVTVTEVPYEEITEEDAQKQVEETQNAIEKYKQQFSQNRHMQTHIVRTVLEKVDKKQVKTLITAMATNLFKVMDAAKENLTKAGYVPGDEFPDETDLLESLSQVLENTFIFGDLFLSRPKKVHKLYDDKHEWQETLTWAYDICSKSELFNVKELKYLDLLAMEAGIIPKSADFHNPHIHKSEKKKKKFEDPKPKEKKKKAKLARGPKMAHTEL